MSEKISNMIEDVLDLVNEARIGNTDELLIEAYDILLRLRGKLDGVIVPPVAVGQTVYFLRANANEVCEARVIIVEENFYAEPQLWLTVEYFSTFVGRHTYKSRIDLMIGKIVFLTREEAEKALERSRG